mmetsp:Transcript_138284/g.441924  ORF Transcript_138284/g.441924 Transcript_138284/m.441924 type:complete len:228 (-) Transcript_138284:841-1524(-)
MTLEPMRTTRTKVTSTEKLPKSASALRPSTMSFSHTKLGSPVSLTPRMTTKRELKKSKRLPSSEASIWSGGLLSRTTIAVAPQMQVKPRSKFATKPAMTQTATRAKATSRHRDAWPCSFEVVSSAFDAASGEVAILAGVGRSDDPEAAGELAPRNGGNLGWAAAAGPALGPAARTMPRLQSAGGAASATTPRAKPPAVLEGQKRAPQQWAAGLRAAEHAPRWEPPQS